MYLLIFHWDVSIYHVKKKIESWILFSACKTEKMQLANYATFEANKNLKKNGYTSCNAL